MSQKYREGDWFSVPLGHGMLAIGLLARRPKRGTLAFGYFFGPPRKQVPDATELAALSAVHAQLVCRFRDGAVHRGLWPVIGRREKWRHKDWPMPPFLRKEGLSGRGIRVEYASDNLTVPTREQEATTTDATLPEDIVYDETRVVEILNRLFAEQRPVTLDPGQWTR
jgi:Immunity protein 26